MLSLGVSHEVMPWWQHRYQRSVITDPSTHNDNETWAFPMLHYYRTLAMFHNNGQWYVKPQISLTDIKDIIAQSPILQLVIILEQGLSPKVTGAAWYSTRNFAPNLHIWVSSGQDSSLVSVHEQLQLQISGSSKCHKNFFLHLKVDVIFC